MSSRLFVALLACMPAAMSAADSVTLTLPEAVRLALAQNRALKIARLKIQEKEQKKLEPERITFPGLEMNRPFCTPRPWRTSKSREAHSARFRMPG
jgi:hypothetical protein